MRKTIIAVVSWLSAFLIIGCSDSDIPVIEQAPEIPTVVSHELVGIEITLKPRAIKTATKSTVTAESAISAKPSATFAPTPIIYTVVEGDTISGIASKLDITVNDILAINPALTPEILLIGQDIVLPAVVIELASTEVVSEPDTLNLEISGLANYRTPFDDLWVLGVVQNNSDHVIGNVRVAIEIHDASDAFESSVEVLVSPGYVLPGEAGPFGFLFDEPPDGELTISAAIQSASEVVDPSILSKDLIIEDAQVTIENNRVTYRGSIRNSGQDLAENIRLVTIFYDEDSFVSGYHTLAIDGQLSSGETVTFQFETIAVGSVNELASSAHGKRITD
jgi:LysM repeat protein